MSIRQGTQVYNSNVYDDTIVPAAAMEPAVSASNLEVDANNIRSMINEIVSSQGGNWYDALAGRDLNTTSADLLSLEERPVTCNASVLTQFAVPNAQNWVILDVSLSQAPSLGGSQSNAVQGVIVATSSLSGAGFDVHELTERSSSGDGSPISPLNLSVVVGTDGQPVQTTTGEDVLALVQVESTFTPDGGAFNDVSAGNRVKLSFVITNAGRTDLIACPVADIENVTISYNYLFNQLLENLDPSCFTGSRGFVDQAADVGVTLSAAISGQGAGAFTAANSINWGLAEADFLDIEDSAGATLMRITSDMTGSGSEILFGSDTDSFDNNAVVNDFVAGATLGSGLASSIAVAVTSGLIEASGALTLESNGSDATLMSTAGGNVVLNSAVNVDIDADTTIMLNTADDTDASLKEITLTSASSTAGNAIGAPVNVNTGDGFGTGQGGLFDVTLGVGGLTGVAGYMGVTHGGDDDERIAQYSVTGTGADQIGWYVGSSSPNARVNANGDIGSLFVDGTNGLMWINTDGATTWTSFAVGGAENWAATLSVGNLTGGNDAVWSSGDVARGVDSGTPSAMTVRGGNATVAATAGAASSLTGGAGNTSGGGGNGGVAGGAGGATGPGGIGSLAGGAGGATSGNGGAATMDGGLAIDGNGGAVTVTGGQGGTAIGNAPGSASLIGGTAGVASGSSGGGAFLTGGPADGTATGGSVNASAADAAAAGGSGGSATLSAGGNLFLSNGNGGPTTVSSGNSQGATFSSGALTLSAGTGSSGALGGDVNVFGGSSDATGETIAGAGSIFLTSGSNSGTDRAGDVGVTAGVNLSAGGEGGRSIYTGGISTGVVDAPIFQLIPGVAGGTGDNGFIHINAGNDGDEAVFRMSASGTSGDGASMFVGSLDPSAGAGVAAEEASTYYRDTGAGAGEMYLKTGTLDTDWSLVVTGTVTADTWAAVLVAGPTSGGTSPIMSSGDDLIGVDSAVATATGYTMRGGDHNGAAAGVFSGGPLTAKGGDSDASANGSSGGLLTLEGGEYTGTGGGLSAGGGVAIAGGRATVGGGLADGGFVTIDGGEGFDIGGPVTITAGRGQSAGGGDASLIGGRGATDGGNVAITGGLTDGGSASDDGGTVSITSGGGTVAPYNTGDIDLLVPQVGPANNIAGGSITIQAGNTGTRNVPGGDVHTSAGDSAGGGANRAGEITWTTGTQSGGSGGPGGSATLTLGGSTNSTPGVFIVTGPHDEDEELVTLTTTGTGGDSVQLFVGGVDPSAGGGVAAPVGSFFYRDNANAGTTGSWYGKTGAAATAWDEFLTGTAGTTSLSAAITAETAANFIATNGTSWGLADTDSFAITGPAGGGDEIFQVNALAAGNTVVVDGDTTINGNDANGGNSIQLLAGAGAAATNGGTGVRLVGGAGNTTGTGGTLSGEAGAGGATGNGGPLIWGSGDGGATSGDSGPVTISTGTVTDGDTGDITLNVENAVGIGTAGGDVILDAGDSPDSIVGGNVVLRTGDSGTNDAGFVHFDTPNDDDEHWGQITTGGTNGTVVQLLAGIQDPNTGSIAAFGGSMYQRRVDAAAGSSLWVNDHTGAGEGVSWGQVLTDNSRSIAQGIASGTIAANTDISDQAAASNVTMDFGTFPTIPSTQAEMDVRTKVYVNGLLQRSGVTVVRTGTQATAIQLTFGLVLGDVITVEQWTS
jgi:hypothetical protein